MRRTGFRWALVAAAATTAILSATTPAAAAPTTAGGDCWRGGTPTWCLGTWRPGQPLPIYVIDHFSDARPNWRSALLTSNSRWTAAAGPQRLATYRRPYDSWIFYEDSVTGRDNLQDNQRGLAWTCSYSGECTSKARAWRVKYASIKLNKNLIANDSGAATTNTFMHETGHALGLMHHPSSSDLMYVKGGTVTTPSADNSGTLPPCAGSSYYSNRDNPRAGVRCVYNWRI
jgi:hypothetical protein